MGASLFASRGARAQDTCATAYESAQELRLRHELSRSRAELRLCERACPKKLADDCSGWRREVEAQLASVVLDARDAGGQVPAGVRVTLDGAPLAAVGAGEAVELDPGKHTLVFEDAAGGRAQADVTLEPGEKGRAVSVRFPPLPAPPAPRPPLAPRVRSAAAPVLGAVGLAGLIAGASLGIKGQVDRAALARTCAPRCDRATQVDPIAAEWWGAAIAALAGAALVGTGAAVWIVEGRAGTPAGAALVVTVVPGPGWVGVTGRF